MRMLLLLVLALPAFAQTWSSCVGPSTTGNQMNDVYIVPAAGPNPRIMFGDFNSSSLAGGLWSTTVLCPTSTSDWTQITTDRATFFAAHPTTKEVHMGTSGPFPMRYMAGNATLTDTGSPSTSWNLAADPTRNLIVAQRGGGDIYSSADWTTRIHTTGTGSPAIGFSVTEDGLWWSLFESVSAFMSSDGGANWTDVGSIGGAIVQIMKLQDGRYLGCDGENSFPKIWNGVTTWTQLSNSDFTGSAGSGTIECTRMLKIGGDIYMVAGSTGDLDPHVWVTSDGVTWTNFTGSGLPTGCTGGGCAPRSIFYDVTSGYLYITLRGNGGQSTALWRTQIATPAGNVTPPTRSAKLTVSGAIK